MHSRNAFFEHVHLPPPPPTPAPDPNVSHYNGRRDWAKGGAVRKLRSRNAVSPSAPGVGVDSNRSAPSEPPLTPPFRVPLLLHRMPDRRGPRPLARGAVHAPFCDYGRGGAVGARCPSFSEFLGHFPNSRGAGRVLRRPEGLQALPVCGRKVCTWRDADRGLGLGGRGARVTV